MYLHLACSEELYVTPGATLGLTILGDVLFDVGDMVYIEDPTYFLVCSVLETSKMSFKGGRLITY